MRVGTNENVKENDQNIENISVDVNEATLQEEKVVQVQDFGQTQKISIINGLEEETNKFREKLFGDNAEEFNADENLNSNNQINSKIVSLNRSEKDLDNTDSKNIQELNPQEKNTSNINETSEEITRNERMENTIVLKDLKELQQINLEEDKKEDIIEKIEEIKEQQLGNNEHKHTQDKKDYKLEKMLFDRINAMQGKIKESLELIKKFERINAKEENLPNIVTTLHDKLTQEVIKQFRTVGIEFNMKSYLVQSIVSDLLSKFEEGISEFKDCSENLNFVKEVQDDFESRVELVATSKVKNLIARLRGMFKPERKQEKLEQLERERQEKKLEEANIHLIKYKFKNNELERYTIKNNITESLTKELLNGHSFESNLTMLDFINQKISPEMEKLGLQNLVPHLEENVFNEYKLKHTTVSRDEFFNMTVGEIKRNMRATRVGYVRTKINNSVSTAESVAI